MTFNYRDLLIGKGHIESRTEYKFTLLRGQLGLLLGIICFSYVLIDSINSVYIFIPWYVAGIATSILIIFLNRLGRYVFSSFVLLITANLLVYLFAAVDNPAGGVYFFFIATSATALVVLNQINHRLGLIFVGVSLLLAALAYFGDFGTPIPPPVQDEYYIQVSFAVNFTLGLISCVAIILFIMKRNKESEDSLISNQEKLEAVTTELEKSKNRFAMAVEGSKSGIYEWQIQTNEVYVSSRWKNLLGYEKEELNVTLEFFLSLVHPEDVKSTSKTVQNAIDNGTSYQNELRMKLKDGSYHWFMDSGLAMKKDGVPVIAVGAISDINDKKIAEQQLLQKNRELEKTNAELDRFVYSASHDMRAPLSTLLGLLELAKMTDDREEIARYFDLMTNRIYTMEGFIKEVTDYSRNARLLVKKEKFKVGPLIDEVLQAFEFLAEESKIKLELDLDPEMEIVSDSARLTVIMNNLIANAIKYHDPHKTERYVEIQIHEEEGNYVITVADNGLGIKEEYQEKIFEMFFRATEISGGSGLGLYIVVETLERLKGSIGCSSKPGEGTIFTVKIPALKDKITEKPKSNIGSI